MCLLYIPKILSSWILHPCTKNELIFKLEFATLPTDAERELPPVRGPTLTLFVNTFRYPWRNAVSVSSPSLPCLLFEAFKGQFPPVPSPQLRCRGSRLSYTWRAAIDSNTEVPDTEAPIQVRHAQDQDNGLPNGQVHKINCLRCASMSNTIIPCNHLCMTAQIQKNKAVVACDVKGCRKTFKKNWKMTQ
jgi:hypothetical protein